MSGPRQLFDHGHALVVGVADYPWLPASARLPASVINDAAQIFHLLGDPERCGYPAHQVKLLRDEQATTADLRDGLRWLAGTDAKDTAIFYFSGHGVRTGDHPSSPSGLAAHDATDRGDGVIPAGELSHWLAQVPAGRLLVVLDCCFAGGAAEVSSSFEMPPAERALAESVYGRLRHGAGRAILAASRHDEAAEAPPELANSLLTHHFLEALHGHGSLRASGVVTLFDVFDHVSKRMARAPHHPILKLATEANFPLALLPRGRRPPTAGADDEVERAFCLDFLESLLPTSFEKVARRLDPEDHSRPPTPSPDPVLDRRRQVENLVHRAEQRGRRWRLELLEAALETLDAFSPIERDWSEWERGGGWVRDGGGIVGAGHDPGLAPGTAPAGFGHGSLVTWRGPRFRDAEVETRLYLPTLRHRGGAGLWLRFRPGGGGVLGLLRSAPPGGATLELWRRDGHTVERLGTRPIGDPDGDGGWHHVGLALRGRRASLWRKPGGPEIEATVGAELPAGHLALARFDDALARFEDLQLKVRSK